MKKRYESEKRCLEKSAGAKGTGTDDFPDLPFYG